jgi:hypothetical protein
LLPQADGTLPDQNRKEHHQEYWIPAEDMNDFNRSIAGRIEVVAEFRGKEPA